MSASLVGSEMCIRDRLKEKARLLRDQILELRNPCRAQYTRRGPGRARCRVLASTSDVGAAGPACWTRNRSGRG
eukprot:6149686-Alexandrium_andersonii.AAC.1